MDTAALLVETLRFRGARTPEQLRGAWASASVRGLERLVVFEQCALWLCQRLRQCLALSVVSPSFADRLARAARKDAAQNLRVDEETENTLRVLGEAGIPYVLLKGAARHAAAALHPYANARATRDVDVLVPANEADRAWGALRAAGYDRVYPDSEPNRSSHHLPPLWTVRRVAVEIHISTSRFLPPQEAWGRALGGARLVRWGGLNVRVPSPTELFWHSLTHAAQEHVLHEGGFRLRYFQDAAVILAAADEIEWEEVARRLGSAEVKDRPTAARWLGAAAALAGVVLPRGILGEATPFDLERSLRWRLGVLRWVGPWPRLADQFLAEEVRAELGQPLTPVAVGASALVRGRHGTAARAARVCYRLWRAA